MKPEKCLSTISSAKAIREPVQRRGINTKEKIVESALEIFCEKGYYKTTTNEIAQRAQVSIGSLYSYFKDKDTIFFEILDKYHEKFVVEKSEMTSDLALLKSDTKVWLRAFMDGLIKVHEDTKELNRELYVLAYYNPEVAEIVEKNKDKTKQTTIGYLVMLKDGMDSETAAAAATVTFDLISATVDRIVFGQNEIDREKLINTTIDMIYHYVID